MKRRDWRVVRLAVVAATALWGCHLPGRGARTPVAAAPAAPIDTAAAKPPVVSPPKAAADTTKPVFVADSIKRDSAARDTTKGTVTRTTAGAAAAAARKAKPAPTTRNCILDFSESPPDTRLTYNRLSETVSNTFIGGGFIGRCQGEKNRLRADSAEQFQAAGVVNLYGNVVYEEPGKMQVTAMHAVYFTREGRLYADGNVVATQLATGSTFSGPSIEYYRATPERPVSRMVAPARSIARLIEKDSTGKLSQPTVVTANRFEDMGDSLILAFGDVIITREALVGRGDSAAFDKPTEKARLMRGARIVNEDSARRFTLTGDTIDMYSKDRQLQRVMARHNGKATSDDLLLEAELIDLRFSERVINEAFAWGGTRARARTPQQDLDADSIRIRLVDKVVREVHAIGGARSSGLPDTTKMRTTERDLLRGDSVYAWFDSSDVARKDTARGARIKEIKAVGNASSLFHVASARGREAAPAMNYVRGRRITVAFDTGAVRDVRVDSAASGIYLEPIDTVTDSTARANAKPATPPPARKPPRSPTASSRSNSSAPQPSNPRPAVTTGTSLAALPATRRR